MLLRECDLGGVGDIKRWDTFAKEKGTACYDDFVPAGWERCLTTMLAYGVGAKGKFGIRKNFLWKKCTEKTFIPDRNSNYNKQVYKYNEMFKK